jgi:hypothetical protein
MQSGPPCPCAALGHCCQSSLRTGWSAEAAFPSNPRGNAVRRTAHLQITTLNATGRDTQLVVVWQYGNGDGGMARAAGEGAQVGGG